MQRLHKIETRANDGAPLRVVFLDGGKDAEAGETLPGRLVIRVARRRSREEWLPTDPSRGSARSDA